MNSRQRIAALRREALPYLWHMNCSLEHVAKCLGMTIKRTELLARTLRLGKRRLPKRRAS